VGGGGGGGGVCGKVLPKSRKEGREGRLLSETEESGDVNCFKEFGSLKHEIGKRL